MRPLTIPSALCVATISMAANAAAPAGQSAYLHGMHDPAGGSWLVDASTSQCDRGWITDLQYVDKTGEPSADCHTDLTNAGVAIIQRLDVSYSESIPHNPDEANGYATSFASFAQQCPNLHVWVVGNEPNVNWSEEVEMTSGANAAAYVAVHQKVHALAGHDNDLVLLAPDSPYSPACICSLRKAIQKVKAQGVTPDGYAVHAYTQGQTEADWSNLPNLVTSEDMSGSNDSCGYPFHWQFRIYRDWIGAIEQEGEGGHPVFITEAGNACQPAQGNRCYPDQNIGYFQAMWAEIQAWNQSSQTKVRAITPYRWTHNDDGTGRDFEIGSRSSLLEDLRAVVQQGYSWTTADCTGPSSCLDDATCTGASVCDVSAGQCVSTEPCGASGSCPSDQICRAPTIDCVPRTRGDATIAVTPVKPAASSQIEVKATSDAGYGNVEMEITGPGGNLATSWEGMEEPQNSWVWSATVGGAGTYRATLRADPASKVYGIAYFQVGQVSWDAGLADAFHAADGAQTPDARDGATSLVDSSLSGNASPDAGDDEGCGCRTPATGGGGSRAGWLLMAVGLGVLSRYRHFAQSRRPRWAK